MDPRRFLTLAALSLVLGGCALLRPVAPAADGTYPVAVTEDAPAEAGGVAPSESLSTPPDSDVLSASAGPAAAEPISARSIPDLVDTRDRPDRPREAPEPQRRPEGRGAAPTVFGSASGLSGADGFIGGIRVFEWRDGRIYEVRTAPLRVTVLTLAPGETVSAKAAGDTVRWQIGESASGSGQDARTHVLIKPLRAGLETNLVLTTNQRVYLLTLRSGEAEAFNPAVVWDHGSRPVRLAAPADPPPSVDVEAVAPQGPLDARFRIQPQGRAPVWTPTAVFTDGVRTFIALSPDARVSEAPALFVRRNGELQLVNYRQSDGLIIVDRRFDEAELRVGGSRPQIVRILRTPGAV